MNIQLDMPFDPNKMDLRLTLEFGGAIALGYAIGMYETDGKTLLWGPIKGTNSDVQNSYPLDQPIQQHKGRFIKINFVFDSITAEEVDYSISVKIQQQGVDISRKQVASGKINNTIEKIRLLIKLI